MPQIIPMKDLRNTNEISRRCHETEEPLFVTKNGYGDLVVMSIESYENLQSSSHLDEKIAAAERELADNGRLLDAKNVLPKLRRKYFD